MAAAPRLPNGRFASGQQHAVATYVDSLERVDAVPTLSDGQPDPALVRAVDEFTAYPTDTSPETIVALSTGVGTAVELAAVNKHHVPGTAYHWRHGYHPLDVATALLWKKHNAASMLHQHGAAHFNAEPEHWWKQNPHLKQTLLVGDVGHGPHQPTLVKAVPDAAALAKITKKPHYVVPAKGKTPLHITAVKPAGAHVAVEPGGFAHKHGSIPKDKLPTAGHLSKADRKAATAKVKATEEAWAANAKASKPAGPSAGASVIASAKNEHLAAKMAQGHATDTGTTHYTKYNPTTKMHEVFQADPGGGTAHPPTTLTPTNSFNSQFKAEDHARWLAKDSGKDHWVRYNPSTDKHQVFDTDPGGGATKFAASWQAKKKAAAKAEKWQAAKAALTAGPTPVAYAESSGTAIEKAQARANDAGTPHWVAKDKTAGKWAVYNKPHPTGMKFDPSPKTKKKAAAKAAKTTEVKAAAKPSAKTATAAKATEPKAATTPSGPAAGPTPVSSHAFTSQASAKAQQLADTTGTPHYAKTDVKTDTHHVYDAHPGGSNVVTYQPRGAAESEPTATPASKVATLSSATPATLADFPTPKGLTPAETSAVTAYGHTHGYTVINPYLHQNGKVFDVKTKTYRPATATEQANAQKWIAGMDAAIAKADPVDTPLVLYRRTNFQLAGDTPRKPGETFSSAAFTSASTSATPLGHGYSYEKKKVRWEITVAPGSKGIPGNKHEKEVVLQRGGQFTVTSDEPQPDGSRLLKVTFTPPTSTPPMPTGTAAKATPSVTAAEPSTPSTSGSGAMLAKVVSHYQPTQNAATATAQQLADETGTPHWVKHNGTTGHYDVYDGDPGIGKAIKVSPSPTGAGGSAPVPPTAQVKLPKWASEHVPAKAVDDTKRAATVAALKAAPTVAAPASYATKSDQQTMLVAGLQKAITSNQVQFVDQGALVAKRPPKTRTYVEMRPDGTVWTHRKNDSYLHRSSDADAAIRTDLVLHPPTDHGGHTSYGMAQQQAQQLADATGTAHYIQSNVVGDGLYHVYDKDPTTKQTSPTVLPTTQAKAKATQIQQHATSTPLSTFTSAVTAQNYAQGLADDTGQPHWARFNGDTGKYEVHNQQMPGALKMTPTPKTAGTSATPVATVPSAGTTGFTTATSKAQQLADQTGTPHWVRFNTTDNTWQVFDHNPGPGGPGGIYNPHKVAPSEGFLSASAAQQAADAKAKKTGAAQHVVWNGSTGKYHVSDTPGDAIDTVSTHQPPTPSKPAGPVATLKKTSGKYNKTPKDVIQAPVGTHKVGDTVHAAHPGGTPQPYTVTKVGSKSWVPKGESVEHQYHYVEPAGTSSSAGATVSKAASAKGAPPPQLPAGTTWTYGDVVSDYKARVKYSSQEKSAAKAYTGVWAGSINSRLRSGDSTVTASDETSMKRMDTLIGKYELPAAITVRRGHSKRRFPTENLAGKVFTDPGYGSTSLGQGFTATDVRWEVTVPKGMHGISTNGMGGLAFPEEREFILPRGTRYHVTSDTMVGNQRKIQAIVVPSDYPPDAALVPVTVTTPQKAVSKVFDTAAHGAYSVAGLQYLREHGAQAWRTKYDVATTPQPV